MASQQSDSHPSNRSTASGHGRGQEMRDVNTTEADSKRREEAELAKQLHREQMYYAEKKAQIGKQATTTGCSATVPTSTPMLTTQAQEVHFTGETAVQAVMRQSMSMEQLRLREYRRNLRAVHSHGIDKVHCQRKGQERNAAQVKALEEELSKMTL
ncbi:hypothetical protein M409DRAFT_52236 [Zasmidium cellare ATCC 36951]|uniref:Uncharacterized protein n=1 Tax=Zasmidium cellare ATCC 36951 TaxID=1080233 RepID=A0A6A6CR04_ZASCE|nr:uncharacterized protein M409DRAFT_52236 [Zasmidium cellare ATCC 36951]KAF2169727.1 hypothetical protein M409DRAFT_52236 [Zasmidium cellare ATCC 36951]